VWNDSSRLAGFGADLAGVLVNSPLPIRWIIADDGSGSSEHAELTRLRDIFAEIFPRVDLHFAAGHRGKGAAVREAWTLGTEAEWLAFVDADGSVTPEDMIGLIDRAVKSGSSVLGIRKRTETTRLVESPWRCLFHHGFLMAARLLLDLQCADPQCGAKVVRGGDYRRVAERLRENGLAFDSELLCALKRDGASWLEIPVNWVEKPGGKVKPLRDGWVMLAALLRTRRRMR
jgi:Glycosyl transferase family 2